jgi:Suppressor of fused protein (SUFU)
VSDSADHPVLSAVATALTERFGHPPQRASVSFVGLQPLEVLRFAVDGGTRAYVTLGMSRDPMTGADAAVLAADGPRAELILMLHDVADRHADIWRRLAVLAASPAVEGLVYRPGLSVDLGEPLVVGSACVGVIVGDDDGFEIATPAGPVSVLPVQPATSTELAWCRVRGAAALRSRWEAMGTDLGDVLRRPVALE